LHFPGSARPREPGLRPPVAHPDQSRCRLLDIPAHPLRGAKPGNVIVFGTMTSQRRFVLLTTGSFGDILPFVGLAKALLERGAPVLLIAPNAELIARAEKIPYHSLAPAEGSPPIDTRPMRAVTTLLNLGDQWITAGLEQTAWQLDELVDKNDVIVAHPIQVAAPLIARRRHLPWIAVSPEIFPFPNAERMPLYVPYPTLGRIINRAAWRHLARRLDRRYLARITAVGKRLGLPGQPTSFLELCRSQPQTLALTSPLFLDSRRFPSNVTATGFANWDVPRIWRARRAVERFIDSGDPPVVFRAPHFFPAHQFRAMAAETCRRLGLRGLFIDISAERTGQDGPLFIDRYVPLSLIAPRALAGVHHGGIGTSGVFAAAGRPAVIVPCIVDQFENAEILRNLGAALRLDWHGLTVSRLTRALSRSLGLMDTAAELARQLRREHGFATAAEMLINNW